LNAIELTLVNFELKSKLSERSPGNTDLAEEARKWEITDEKTKADILLVVMPSKLRLLVYNKGL